MNIAIIFSIRVNAKWHPFPSVEHVGGVSMLELRDYINDNALQSEISTPRQPAGYKLLAQPFKVAGNRVPAELVNLALEWMRIENSHFGDENGPEIRFVSIINLSKS